MDNIFKNDIQTGLEMAWHGKTNVVETITRENSGICYSLIKRPLYRRSDNGNYEVSPDNFELVATDNNLPVGRAVSEAYEPITNVELWDMTEQALGGTRHKIVSCGTVCGRTKVFISIELNEAFRAANRITKAVLNILSGHCGVLSVKAKSGFTVVVCDNTFTLSLREHSDFVFNVVHKRGAKAKLANMAEAIDRHFGVVKEFQTAMDSLANNACNLTRAERIYAGFVTPPKHNAMSTRTRNIVTRLGQLFANGRGNAGENEADLFNGLTDYFTHESSGGNNTWKQFESSEFGAAANRKLDFYNLLVHNRETLADIERRGDRLMVTATVN